MLENDHTQSLEIAAKLRDAVQKLHNMSDDVGAARQIKEFSSERRKNLLAKYVARTVDGSQSARETAARVHPEYSEEFEVLAKQELEAEKIIARWQAENCRYDAARSLLSFSKGIKNDLMG